MRKKNQSFAFTIIEILFVFFLVGVVISLSVSQYQKFSVRNDLEVATNTITQNLRRAQLLAQSGREDSDWGVKIASSTSTIFQGSSFATRNTDHDEISTLAGTITPSGNSETIFNKLTGFPTATTSITLTSKDGDSHTININTKGRIDY